MDSSGMLDSIKEAFGVLFMGRNFARLMGGLWVTISIAAVSVALSLVLGFIVGIIMTSKNKIVRAVCRVYLEFMRIMPQLVLLFLAYFLPRRDHPRGCVAGYAGRYASGRA